MDESRKLPLPDTGLEGALFAMLDTETEPVLRAHIQVGFENLFFFRNIALFSCFETVSMIFAIHSS